MKRLFPVKLVLALVFGAAIVAVVSVLSSDEDFEDEHPYGEPDGEVANGDVSSFVD